MKEDTLTEIAKLAGLIIPGPWEVDRDAAFWTEEGYAAVWIDTPAGRIMMPSSDTGSDLVSAEATARLLVLLRRHLPEILEEALADALK